MNCEVIYLHYAASPLYSVWFHMGWERLQPFMELHLNEKQIGNHTMFKGFICARLLQMCSRNRYSLNIYQAVA